MAELECEGPGPQQCEMAVGGQLWLAYLCMYVRMVTKADWNKRELALFGGLMGSYCSRRIRIPAARTEPKTCRSR